MKTIHLPFIVFAILICTASCSQRSKFENTAKTQLESTIKEIAKDPSSVKLSDVETVYIDDSLCIIHANIIGKNAFGADISNQYEYILISSNGNNYESINLLGNNNESVFVNKEKYNSVKKGTFYETLTYEAGLRFLAAICVNTTGRKVGDSNNESFNIPVPTGTGAWNLFHYQDEFGEILNTKYLALAGHGFFSNSATTNSEMTSMLYVDKDFSFSFMLVEYNSHIVKSGNKYMYEIKDSSGNIHSIILHNNRESGQMYPVDSRDKEILKNILLEEGTIVVNVKELGQYYSTPDTYLFRLDLTGFNKAISYL